MSQSQASTLTQLGTYPRAVLAADAGRAGLGLFLTLGPFLWVTPHPVIAVPLLVAGALFLAFAGRTVLRWQTRVESDETGIRTIGPLGTALAWAEIRDVRLRFYSLRRHKSVANEGWMELSLRGQGRRLVLESTLAGFERVIAGVAEAARTNRLDLDEATRDNLLQYGEHVPRPRP